MAIKTLTELKAYFETGDFPTESQFADLIESTKNHIINVDDYGAVGDGVTDDTQAIIDAMTAVGNNSNTAIGFTSGKTYLISGNIPINSTIGGSAILLGYGATIKRADETKTTLTAAAADQTTTLSVTDASDFAVGDTIIVTDETDTYSGAGYNENSAGADLSPHTITAIDGNTITLDKGLDLPKSTNLDGAGEYPIGAPVVKVYNMFTGGSNMQWHGLTFDGNKDNNASTVAWFIQGCARRVKTGSIISNCIFKNMPSENIFVEKGVNITDNRFENNNGSCIHISSGDSDETVVFNDNQVKDCCLSAAGASIHSEAVVTCSAGSINININGGTMYDCNGFVLGSATTDGDFNLKISDLICSNVDGVFDYRANTDSALGYKVRIDNCIFDNCRAINFAGLHVFPWQEEGFDRVAISDNLFTNTQVSLLGTNINFHDNDFVLTDGYSFPADSELTESERLCQIYGVNVHVHHNTLDNRRVTEGDFWKYAFFCPFGDSATQAIKSDISTSTDYDYYRNNRFTHNTILGFSIALATTRNGNGGATHSSLGNEFNHNLVVARQGTISAGLDSNTVQKIILRTYPGWLVEGNRIYGSSEYDQAILAYGVKASKENDFNGPIIINNKILGFTKAATLGRGSSFTSSDGNNIIFKDNIYGGSIDDWTNSTNSTVSGNIVLPVSETPRLDIVRDNPEFY